MKPVKTALMLWLHGNDSIPKATIFAASRHTLQCYTTLGGLSTVCAKLEPASSKNNETLEINVLQIFTPHALCSKPGLHDAICRLRFYANLLTDISSL